MAVIGKIRNQSGLLIGLVGLAMVLFVGGDLLRGNSSFFGQPDTDVGEINGEKISYQEFEGRVAESTNGQSVPSDQMDQVRNRVWNRILQERLVETEYANLGIQVSDEELWEEIKNNPRNPILNQYFTNPQTGQLYDQFKDPATGGLSSQQVLFYIKQILNSETPENWIPVETAIRSTLLSTKYNEALKAGLNATSFDAGQKNQEDNKRLTLAYAGMNYSDISSEDISYDESDLKAYYNAHRNEQEYKQTETNRSTKVAIWNVFPSEEDVQNAQEDVAAMIAGFESAENDTLFVLQNSDDRNGFQTVGRFEMPEDIDSILFTAEVGTVMGPYDAGGAFKITKKLAVKMRADSVRARHILIQPSETLDTATAQARVDSLLAAIKGGADFAELAQSFSADLGSAQKGGDLEWFTWGQMVPEFNNACFEGKVGDMPVVTSQFGIHLIEITDKTEDKEKVEIASVTRVVTASESTFERAYNKASEFSIQNNTLEAFKAAGEENPEIVMQDFEYIKEGDKVLGNLENPRPVVRWAYESNVGDVSEVFEIGNSFVVASLTSIKNEGTLPFEEVKDKIEDKVINEKKAEVILSKFGGETSVEGISSKLGTSVQSASDVSFSNFSIAGIGPEAKLLGIAFGLEEGETSEVYQGETGVYVVRVDKIFPADETANLDLTRDQISRTVANRVEFEVFEALKEKSGVVDNRHKFY